MTGFDLEAAQRIKDQIDLHLQVAAQQGDMWDAVGLWAAFLLSDGTSDGTLYPSKQQAIDHQRGSPKNYAYMKITPDGITAHDAIRWLRICRNPMIDNTAPEHILNPQVFERFSNLTPEQKLTLRRRLERDREQRNSA